MPRTGSKSMFFRRPLWVYALIGLGYGSLLLAAILTMGTLFQRFFTSGIMRVFGKYSYGAYVWHRTASRLAREPTYPASLVCRNPPDGRGHTWREHGELRFVRALVSGAQAALRAAL